MWGLGSQGQAQDPWGTTWGGVVVSQPGVHQRGWNAPPLVELILQLCSLMVLNL